MATRQTKITAPVAEAPAEEVAVDAAVPAEQTPVAEEPTAERGNTTTIQAVDESPFQAAATPAVDLNPVIKTTSSVVLGKDGEIALPMEVGEDVHLPLTRLAQEGGILAISQLLSVMQYAVDMAPGKTMDEVTGARQQQQLWGHLKTLLERTEGDWRLRFTTLLNFVAENRAKSGAFSDTHVFRFMTAVTMSHTDLQAYQSVINIITHLGEYSTRALHSKDIAWSRVLTTGLKPEAREKVLAYFQG
jgi:hypothetical protein